MTVRLQTPVRTTSGAAPSRRLARCLATCLALTAGPLAARAPGQDVGDPAVPARDYAQTYVQSFRGAGGPPDGWKLASRLSEECVQFEPAGLRITLPPGGPEQGQSAGIVTDFGVRGDFEITLTFEALDDPAPADVGASGTRLSLAAVLDTPRIDTPKKEVATLSRNMANRGFVTWVRNRHDAAPLVHGFPTPAKAGRLRLVRRGDELTYLASVGADQPFVPLTHYRFGAEDVKRIAISGQTGGPKALVDMRVTDFRVRAEAIPGAPALENSAPGAAAPAPPPRSSRGALVALIVFLSVAGLLALGLLLRKRRPESVAGAGRRTPP